jgi:RNA polymerase sigma-70 factor, ECF subfamily
MTDEAIIEQVLAGNTHIFSELVNRYKNKVFSLVYRFTNDYGDAQDISQEVFINVFRKLYTFSEKASFSTWVYRISYNYCIDWTRKNKKRLRQEPVYDEQIELADTGMNVEESFLEMQKRVHLRKAILQLDEKYRNVLILFHFQELSYEEIGEVMQLPVKTVETRLYRGRQQLRKYLSGIPGGEFYEVQTGI